MLLIGLLAVDTALARGGQATEALTGIFELPMLTTDYLANHEPRAQVQWHEQFLSLQDSLAETDADGDDEAVLARLEGNLVQAHGTSMSHELRTPLNSVIGFTGLMLKGRTGGLSEEQRRQIGMVNDAGQQLLALVNEVLELNRIDAGALSIIDAPFDPTDAVSRLVEMMAPVAAGKGLHLGWIAAEGVSRLLVSDRDRLDQILLNLIGNAIKFTAHGSVEVAVRAEGPDAIAFSVEDSGIGIAPEDFEGIFEHFHQVQTGPAGEAGAGLGLSISRRLAGALGGTLTVASEVGEGSIFTLTLPVERAAREPGVTDAEG